MRVRDGADLGNRRAQRVLGAVQLVLGRDHLGIQLALLALEVAENGTAATSCACTPLDVRACERGTPLHGLQRNAHAHVLALLVELVTLLLGVGQLALGLLAHLAAALNAPLALFDLAREHLLPLLVVVDGLFHGRGL